MARYSTTHDISRLLDLACGLARNPIIFNLCLLGQLSQNSARARYPDQRWDAMELCYCCVKMIISFATNNRVPRRLLQIPWGATEPPNISLPLYGRVVGP